MAIREVFQQRAISAAEVIDAEGRLKSQSFKAARIGILRGGAGPVDASRSGSVLFQLSE